MKMTKIDVFQKCNVYFLIPLLLSPTVIIKLVLMYISLQIVLASLLVEISSRSVDRAVSLGAESTGFLTSSGS
jgi:hypothetical protein